MLGTHHLGMFITAGLLLNASPGPDTLYIIGRTLAQGRSAGIASALGISTGCLIHTLGAAFGLSAVLASSALAFSCIKLAGAAYLIYLGVRMVWDRSKVDLATSSIFLVEGTWVIYRQAILTNVLNPKVALFFLAFLPQFVSAHTPTRALSFLFLGLLFIVNGTLYCLALVFFAAELTRRLRRDTAVVAFMKRFTGTGFVGLGIKLALDRRTGL